MKVALLADIVETSKKKLDSIKKNAKIVVEAADEHVLATANLAKEELVEALASHETKVVEYKAFSMEKNSQGEEEKYTAAITLDALELDEIMELKMKLSAVISKTQGLSETKSKTSSSVEVNQSKVNKTDIAKLQKLSYPKFSGTPRDFVRFKRNFNKLVNVAGRSAIEIGSNLQNAIPERFQHLISHLETDDHEGMMEVLEERFGPGCLVVQDIVNQIERMKPVTSDKGFIEFVEKVEQMKLNLEALHLLDELANHSCILNPNYR